MTNPVTSQLTPEATAVSEDIDISQSTGTIPGRESTYAMHKFAAVIPESAFMAEGYVESQRDKTNYYVWELIQTGGKSK